MTEQQGTEVLEKLATIATSNDRILYALEWAIVALGILIVFTVVGSLARWRN